MDDECLLYEGSSAKRRKEGDALTGLQSHVEEIDVGITEYVNSTDRFSGIIKQRYSDFVVNEIDMDSTVVHLTNTEAALESDKPAVDSCYLSDTDRLKLEELAKEDSSIESVEIKVSEDKSVRTGVHLLIKQDFPQLESCTTIKDDNQRIILVHRRKVPQQCHGRGWWPSTRGDYTHFLLYKENKDTADTVGLLAKFLNVKASRFMYAGNKDRRAVTVQKMSVYRVTAEKLSQLNKRLKDIRVGNFRYEKEPLRLGQLWGNMFSILLRNVVGDCDCIERSLLSVRDMGFINYFGMQRFGTYSVPTYEVGKALLHSNWAAAIDNILNPTANESSDIMTARRVWIETKDARKTLEKLPRHCTIERQLLQGIQKHGIKDACNALNFIPRNTRMMYVHSYQSLVWNRVVSRRIQTYGLKPVKGDLIVSKDSLVSGTERQKLGRGVKVELLTDETVRSHTIHDIVLPLPGYDVNFPNYGGVSWYEEILAGDNLTFQMLNHRVKDYALSGSYRRMIIKPVDMTWKMLSYNDKTIPLIPTDLNRLESKSHAGSIEGGKLAAVCVEFSLPSSCYATMALREATKTDTSAANQSKLNEKLASNEDIQKIACSSQILQNVSV